MVMAQHPSAATLPADPTLDEIRAALAPLVAASAAFDGFTAATLDEAADALGVDRDVARLAFPGGARDMVDAWFATIDTAMAERCPAETLATMKIRERITRLVETRIDLLAANRESLRLGPCLKSRLPTSRHPGLDPGSTIPALREWIPDQVRDDEGRRGRYGRDRLCAEPFLARPVNCGPADARQRGANDRSRRTLSRAYLL